MTRAFLVLALTVPACATDGDDPCVELRKQTANRISLNKLAANRISLNKLSANGVLDQALSTDALRGDGAPAEDLRDPGMREVFAYMVQCALDPDQSVEVAIDGELVAFEGAIGLAPAWGEPGGSCDATCQHWVSACLIARVNAEGESVAISLRGEHPGLHATADELASYDTVEATYYGNVFGDAKRMHACLPDGASAIPRVCGDDPSCVVHIEGSCSDLCEGSSCRTGDGTVFDQTITVQRDTSACGG